MIETIFAVMAACTVGLIFVGIWLLGKLRYILGSAALALALVLFLVTLNMAFQLPRCFRGPAPWWCQHALGGYSPQFQEKAS